MGLAQEQLGQTKDALAAFLKAEETAPQSEIVQFFLGREYLFLAEFEPDRQEELWQKAEDAFLKSIALDDQYAKAYLGLGSVYMKRSAELLDTAMTSKQAVDPQSLQFAEQGIETYKKVLELNPDPDKLRILIRPLRNWLWEARIAKRAQPCLYREMQIRPGCF